MRPVPFNLFLVFNSYFLLSVILFNLPKISNLLGLLSPLFECFDSDCDQ